MALPAPNLDDRRFQELVDDAKRLVMRRCPEWTDHNVSDPGVTLIETFAYITDQLLYRLNRVPDRLYVKFLDLIGVRMFPPTPARVALTFWLSTPATGLYTIPVAVKASTLRTENDEPIVFATSRELSIVPCALEYVATEAANDQGDRVDRTDELHMTTQFAAFQPARPGGEGEGEGEGESEGESEGARSGPQAGDAIWFGLSEAVPRCAVRFQFVAHIDGIGVDPTNPPLTWEAWTGDEWTECEVESDETGGLNRDGSVIIHVPDGHEVSIVDERRAGWVRARVLEHEEGRPDYSSSPIIHSVTAETVGGTTDAIHADIIENEPLGESEGVPGQRFNVARTPVLTGAGAAELVSTSDEGWQEWSEVENFVGSGPDDRHFIFDAVHGEVVLGPAVRELDGRLTQRGWVPPKGTELVMRRYSVGGGRTGNVNKGTITVMRTSMPFVSRVENRYPATGGVEGETLQQAKDRGPILLRTRSRAVTGEDYEHITREAAPEVARVRCLTAGEHDVDAGSVKVLLVPAAPIERGRIRFEDLVPSPETFERVKDRLEETRLVGARVVIEPPLYRGITVVARLLARPRTNAQRIQEDAMVALQEYLNPLIGGPDGTGWPFGRPVQAGEVYATLQRIKGVDLVEDVRVFGANPVTGERGKEAQRIDLEPNSLVFSYEHQVRVEVQGE